MREYPQQPLTNGQTELPPPLKPQTVVQENYLKTTDSGKIEPSPFFKSQTVVQELPPMTPDKWLVGAEENSNW